MTEPENSNAGFEYGKISQMTERADSGVPEQSIKAEVGQSFKPFEGLVNLPTPDKHETYVESVDYILSRDFELGGIKATIALSVEEEVCLPDMPRPYEAPLGEPTVEYTYVEGREAPLKTPLQLITFATIDSLPKYIELNKHQLKFQIGDKVYYLDCAEQFDNEERRNNEEAGEIINNGVMENWGGGHFTSRGDLYDGEGNLTGVVLPYDPEKLSTIEVTIVPKVFGQPANSESEPVGPPVQ